MRWLVGVLALLGLAWAQTLRETEALNRCQRIFSDIRPLVAYTEEVQGSGLLLRVILGRPGQWIVRLTFDGSGELVPMGLEEVAPPLIPAQRVQLETLLRSRLLSLFQDINLASWAISEDAGFRCVVVHKGRWVGLIRLSRNLRPLPNPEWNAVARLARLRLQLQGVPSTEPQKPNP